LLHSLNPSSIQHELRVIQIFITYLVDIGVSEVIHEKMNSSQAEALIISWRQSSLQFLIIDQTTSVLISHLEASHDARVCARRKCRRK